jgi:hypothetical protein
VIYKTRKNRKFTVETLDLSILTDFEREDLCQRLFAFSEGNILTITYEYLLKRLTNYNILCLALSDDQIIGFGFANHCRISLSRFRNLPLIHFGLMIIGNDWRGDRVSSIISKCLARFVIKKSGIKTYLTGFAISAKCSSPVSFYRLQQGSMKLGFPKFDSKGELDFISKTKIGQTLSQSVSEALGLGAITDFVIRDSNLDSGFQLAKEKYITNSPYESKVLAFFQKKVIPHNEVLFISYAHPILAL